MIGKATQPALPDRVPAPVVQMGRRDVALAVTHAPILVIVVALGLVDLATSNLFGVFLSGTLSLPLLVFVIGFARHRRGRGDGRMIMAIADGAILLILGTFLPQALRTGMGGIATPAAVLLAALTVGGLASVALARPQPGSSPVRRSRLNALGGLAFVLLGMVSTFAPLLSIGSPLRLDLVVFGTAPSIISLALKALAWWWGAGWVLAVAGIGYIASAANVALLGGMASAANAMILGVLSLALAARPPRVVGERAPSSSGRPNRPPGAAIAWALTGAILLAPSLLLGPLAPRLVDCLDCPSPSPLATPSVVLDVVLLVLLPAVAIALSVATRSGRIPSGALAWIGFVASGLVVGQALLAILDVPGFAFFVPVGPAAAIATVGFGLAIARPAFITGVGSWSAVGCALVGMAWMSGVAGPRSASIDFSIVQISTLVTGALVTLALGREFAIRPGGESEKTAADLPIRSADPGRRRPR